jgi:hypothetical protein
MSDATAIDLADLSTLLEGADLSLVDRSLDRLSMLHPAIGRLVIELAARIEPLPDILRKYGVPAEEFKTLLRTPAFRAAIAAATSDFQSLANTPARIKLKSQLMVEMGLQEMWNLIADPRALPGARVSAFAAVRSLTGLEKPDAPAAAPNKFSLTINLPNPTDPAATPAQMTIEYDGEATEQAA